MVFRADFGNDPRYICCPDLSVSLAHSASLAPIKIHPVESVSIENDLSPNTLARLSEENKILKRKSMILRDLLWMTQLNSFHSNNEKLLGLKNKLIFKMKDMFFVCLSDFQCFKNNVCVHNNWREKF